MVKEQEIYRNGKYCTFPHAIELLNRRYEDIFPILTSYPDLENYLSPFMDAWLGGAAEQLQGQIASEKIPLSRMISPALYWVMSDSEFTLDINNPEEPKILCVGNNPDRQNIYGAALGLYNSPLSESSGTDEAGNRAMSQAPRIPNPVFNARKVCGCVLIVQSIVFLLSVYNRSLFLGLIFFFFLHHEERLQLKGLRRYRTVFPRVEEALQRCDAVAVLPVVGGVVGVGACFGGAVRAGEHGTMCGQCGQRACDLYKRSDERWGWKRKNS